MQNSATSTTVTSSGFSSNSGKEGGAVNVAAGTLSVSESTFDGNYASGNGGALRFSVASGKASLSNVTVSGNNAGGSGGGLGSETEKGGGKVCGEAAPRQRRRRREGRCNRKPNVARRC